jgi:hypothetical protein
VRKDNNPVATLPHKLNFDFFFQGVCTMHAAARSIFPRTVIGQQMWSSNFPAALHPQCLPRTHAGPTNPGSTQISSVIQPTQSRVARAISHTHTAKRSSALVCQVVWGESWPPPVINRSPAMAAKRMDSPAGTKDTSSSSSSSPSSSSTAPPLRSASRARTESWRRREALAKCTSM